MDRRCGGGARRLRRARPAAASWLGRDLGRADGGSARRRAARVGRPPGDARDHDCRPVTCDLAVDRADGTGTGRPYSYDALENLVGCHMHSADQIVGEWQSVAVGESFRLHPTSRSRSRASSPSERSLSAVPYRSARSAHPPTTSRGRSSWTSGPTVRRDCSSVSATATRAPGRRCSSSPSRLSASS